MPRLSISILSHQKRIDKSYPISINVTHMGKSAYIPTGRSATEGQLSKSGGKTSIMKIKDRHLYRDLLDLLDFYEKELCKISTHGHTAKTLSKYLKTRNESQKKDGQLIDFISVSRKYVRAIRSKQPATATKYNTLLNSLEDFLHRDLLYTKEINSKFLKDFESFMRTERQMIRKDQFGIDRERTVPPITDTTIYGRMKDFRALFYMIRNTYNDEDEGLILVPNNPFHRHPISQPLSSPRAEDIDCLISLYFAQFTSGSNEELGRDIFFLSFFTMGMNLTDIYHIKKTGLKDGRLEYNRRKTMGKRKDGAFISVRIEDIAKPLIDKYTSSDGSTPELFCFKQRYTDKDSFIRGVNNGLKSLCNRNSIKPVTTYVARHSFATFARNECEISKDTISLMLNHAAFDKRESTVDLYLKRDWSLIDKANEKVVRYFLERTSSFQK